MCTAISFTTQDHYFGRNLDLEYSYEEAVVITPRNFPFRFPTRYGLIGMAYVPHDYPLYYDATNEAGLSMAGLRFPNEAVYHNYEEAKHNIAPFEFIPWVLGQCSTVKEAASLLRNCNLLKQAYSDELPLTPLHWIISDHTASITIESVEDGLLIYPNTVGVLTNNPAFDFQMAHWNSYQEAHKIPGDWSSQSRFIRASFVKKHAVCDFSETASVNQFFHILDSVSIPRGSVHTEKYSCKITQYSSCCNTNRGIYYYKTYNNSQLTAVHLHHVDLEDDKLILFPLVKEGQILWQN